MGKKDRNAKRAPKGRARFRQGYVSFDIEELRQVAEEGTDINAEAYGYIYDAVNTTSDVRLDSNRLDVDDVYPMTAEETEEMRRLLDKAEEVAGDREHPHFRYCMNEMREIIDWSSKRHWNFQWGVILGVIFTVLFLSWRVDKKTEDLEGEQAKLEMVKNWSKADTVVAWEDIPYVESVLGLANYHYNYAMKDARNYKLYLLMYAAATYNNATIQVEKYTAMVDTASKKEFKKTYEEYVKSYSERAVEARKEYDKINGYSFKKVQKIALEEAQGEVKSAKEAKRAVRAWNIFFILLIPVYIFAERPYGYTLTRYRAEAETLGGIRKFAWGLSAALAGTAASISYIETVTKWSDGRVERTTDAGTNAPVVIAKVALYVAAFAVICIVSCLLMLYMTIMGLIRNYNWKQIYAKVKASQKKTAVRE